MNLREELYSVKDSHILQMKRNILPTIKMIPPRDLSQVPRLNVDNTWTCMWQDKLPSDFWDGGRLWINNIHLHNLKYIVAMGLVDDDTWIECENFTETSYMYGLKTAIFRGVNNVRQVRWKKRES